MQDQAEPAHWRRNMFVCLFGSFTTIVAMTLMLPFLPLYVAQLGVRNPAAIVQWSGIAYGATFFTAALVAPFWGLLADRYGRKLMLIRASIGMTIAMSAIGMAGNVWQLVALRLFAGIAGGYASGSTVFVATQTPKDRVGWALGMLSSGIMAGSLAGPLIGGALPPLIGIRATFWAAGAVIFLAFLATSFLIKEDFRPAPRKPEVARTTAVVNRPLLAMLLTGLMLMVAQMSIEPIITVYVARLVHDARSLTLISGIVMAAAALGSILSASRLGRLADRIGHWNVVIAALTVSALLLIPQAFVTAAWQLIILRFLMGLSLGGLLPCIAAVIRHAAPECGAGKFLGYSTSAQYAGQVAGPLLGGFVGGQFGMRPVFLATALLLAAAAAYNWRVRSYVGKAKRIPTALRAAPPMLPGGETDCPARAPSDRQ
jgi:MFS family permease